jgi:hypothetical protein
VRGDDRLGTGRQLPHALVRPGGELLAQGLHDRPVPGQLAGQVHPVEFGLVDQPVPFGHPAVRWARRVRQLHVQRRRGRDETGVHRRMVVDEAGAQFAYLSADAPALGDPPADDLGEVGLVGRLQERRVLGEIGGRRGLGRAGRGEHPRHDPDENGCLTHNIPRGSRYR